MQIIPMPELEKRNPLVVQSNKLIESRYSLTTGEQRLIFAMISLIHPNDEDFKLYVLKLSDLAFYLNMDIRNVAKEVDKITSRLMERVIHIPQANGDLLKAHWVSSAEHKKGYVELEFSQKLKPYLLRLKEQFTQYHLTTITQFQSIYSIRIYGLLKQYQSIGFREFNIDELKEILGISQTEYKEFKRFKARVINQAKKEFEQKIGKYQTYRSDITFDLETMRTGRKITHLRFNIRKQPYQEELPMDFTGTQPPQIQKLVYFGLSEKQASQLYKTYGSEAIENALDLYAERLQSGKVKNQSGAYLKTLIEQKATLKTPYEKEQETQKKLQEVAKKKQAKQKKEAEQKKKEEEQQKRDVLQAQFEALPESEQSEILAEFEKTLTLPIQRKNYKTKGVNTPMLRGLFYNFLES